MKVIARPQCTGKTKELIEYSLINDIPIWCLSESKRRSLIEKSMHHFGKCVEVICGAELLNSSASQILIDDAAKMLQFLIDDFTTSPISLAGFTATTEN